MVGISSATAAYYNSLGASANGQTNWMSSAITAIKNSANPAGIMGALASSGNAGTLSSFLGQASSFANNLATITTTSTSNYGSFYAQMASQNQQKAAQKKLEDALKALNDAQAPPQKQLDPFIYLGGGVSIDTTSNIMTMTDGTQIDITTGAPVVDSANILQLGNGSYLNTKTNILTLSDGTKIDNVTGLKVDTTA